jgi:hypothetical protein
VPSCVLRSDNGPRVRDGYIRESTCGHARALPTHAHRPICRRNVIASARPCPPVPPGNLHGKEGVDGSSPSEGSAKAPHIGAFSVEGTCTISSVQWVWSRLWSFQVQNGAGVQAAADRETSRPRQGVGDGRVHRAIRHGGPNAVRRDVTLPVRHQRRAPLVSRPPAACDCARRDARRACEIPA